MMDIVIKNLNKSYGDKVVLSDFSAVFPEGKCTCIMGQSGSGKSTLLRLITGLEKPDSGSIEPTSAAFSMVFQEDRLCEDFSIASNIRLVLKKDTDLRDGDIKNLLEEMGLNEDIYTQVSLLSGGMKRRVAIARALVYDSDWMILDEPFKGLDETTRQKVTECIKKKRKSIIMVSHDPEEAKLMGAEVVNMDK